MAIWHKKIDLDALNKSSENTLVEHLGIRYTQFDDNSLSATCLSINVLINLWDVVRRRIGCVG